jgi:hypothetical protein
MAKSTTGHTDREVFFQSTLREKRDEFEKRLVRHLRKFWHRVDAKEFFAAPVRTQDLAFAVHLRLAPPARIDLANVHHKFTPLPVERKRSKGTHGRPPEKAGFFTTKEQVEIEEFSKRTRAPQRKRIKKAK